ncbi:MULTISPECIES: universal stress protein [unclassified Streptomyces]|uniref:universal stress protein n=1 Tax=unclassified Streptomyces TaxID=2593676 RepID=UPI0005AA5A7E|nr:MULTISPECIES: universal stress protein [unclassified Streptomyces]ODA70186.1 Universal stress protein [Streptomyces sp. AVP053U2]
MPGTDARPRSVDGTVTVTAGLDGSPESRAAAEWAAREARLLGLPLRLVHVWEPVPEPLVQAPLLGGETQRHWTERIPREAAEGVRARHPGLDVITEQLSGRPAEAPARAAEDTELLVLGSRGLSGIGGFLVGSVGLSVVAYAERPVVLVRAGEQAADEHETHPAGVPSAATPLKPVVLGLDVEKPDDEVIGFAFAAAARRATSLRVVHGWTPPPSYAYGLAVDRALARQETGALTEVLRPWRAKFPDVEVTEESPCGTPGSHLADASREASLVVVGRRIRRSPFGARIGPVTHAVLYHSVAPVAVVPHG